MSNKLNKKNKEFKKQVENYNKEIENRTIAQQNRCLPVFQQIMKNIGSMDWDNFPLEESQEGIVARREFYTELTTKNLQAIVDSEMTPFENPSDLLFIENTIDAIMHQIKAYLADSTRSSMKKGEDLASQQVYGKDRRDVSFRDLDNLLIREDNKSKE